MVGKWLGGLIPLPSLCTIVPNHPSTRYKEICTAFTKERGGLMNSVITMVKLGNYVPFCLFPDGSAVSENNGIRISYPDFASTFIQMCDRGWRKVSEMQIESSKSITPVTISRKGDRPKGMLRQLNGYRQDWYSYMGEWENNNEEFDFCLNA